MEILLSWPGGDWQTTLRLVAAIVAGYFLLLWATYILWVVRDIRLRTHDPVSQIIAILIAIILPFITFPIYITLRPRETLQDSYLKLLEREVLFSQLEEIQSNSQLYSSSELNSSENALFPVMDKDELTELDGPTLFFDDIDEIEFDEFVSENKIVDDSAEDLHNNLEDEAVNDTIEKPLQKLSFDEVEEVNFEIENTDSEKSVD
ncbi:MAG: hypothetical protein CL792_02230 [Chloroflexi bacterium]|nr:hypothetical protein [Chloroflexota bacterium]